MFRRFLGELRYQFGPPPMRVFSDYDDYWQKREPLDFQRRWKIAADLIDGGTVLDVGCGRGEFLEYLRERKPGIRCKGMDCSDRSIGF